MKRRPSLKRRTKFSDSDSGDYRSALTELPGSVKRKPVESFDPAAADGQWTWEWDDAGLEFIAQQTRR